MNSSRSIPLAALILVLWSTTAIQAKDRGDQKQLGPETGASIATGLNQGIAANPRLCAPAHVVYEKQSNKIHVTILGGQARVTPDANYPEENPGARESLNTYWSWVMKQFCRIEKKHGVRLSKEDVTMVYLYNPSPLYAREMIRIEDGQIRKPARKDSSLATDSRPSADAQGRVATLP